VVKFLDMLSTPARLGDVVPDALHPGVQATVTKLILDGVLKVRVDGEFVCGVYAFARCLDSEKMPDPVGLAEQLSLRATQYGEQLLPRTPRELAARLYGYNSVPAGARWASRLPTVDATRHYLGVDTAEIARAARTTGWSPSIDPSGEFPWFGWMAREATLPATKNGRTALKPRPVYKLYISVRPDHARAALAASAPEVFRSRAIALKIGAGVHGVLRPDKMVAYFRSYRDLEQAAASLDARLCELPAQGVPFTASISDNGALSWGIDPAVHLTEDPIPRHSWRLRIVGRLATGLASVESTPTAGLPSRFALARLRLDGIDLLTPNPVAALDAVTPYPRTDS
jgi:hypothetical protein